MKAANFLKVNQFQIKAGDAFEIPPGHDAWVEGNETCELIDFGGYTSYARPQETEKKSA